LSTPKIESLDSRLPEAAVVGMDAELLIGRDDFER